MIASPSSKVRPNSVSKVLIVSANSNGSSSQKGQGSGSGKTNFGKPSTTSIKMVDLTLRMHIFYGKGKNI